MRMARLALKFAASCVAGIAAFASLPSFPKSRLRKYFNDTYETKGCPAALQSPRGGGR